MRKAIIKIKGRWKERNHNVKVQNSRKIKRKKVGENVRRSVIIR